jgi:hypothetical protein
MIVVLGAIIIVVICVLAARHRAQVFNARDASRDYRTTPQRMWDQ